MNMVKWAKNRMEKYHRSRKAISTIMANLTMLVIVVVLSSLLFVWAVASFGTYQGGAGYFFSSRSLANQERLSVENVFFYQSGPSSFAKVYVRNVGTIPVTVASVYINSTLYNLNPQQTVNVGQVCLLGSNCSPSTGLLMSGQFGRGYTQTVKLATLRGTTWTTTWVA